MDLRISIINSELKNENKSESNDSDSDRILSNEEPGNQSKEPIFFASLSTCQ